MICCATTNTARKWVLLYSMPLQVPYPHKNKINVSDLLQSTSKFGALFLHPVPIRNPEGTSQICAVFNSCSFALNTLPWVFLDCLSILMKEMSSSSIHLIKFMSIFTLPNPAAFGTWKTLQYLNYDLEAG